LILLQLPFLLKLWMCDASQQTIRSPVTYVRSLLVVNHHYLFLILAFIYSVRNKYTCDTLTDKLYLINLSHHNLNVASIKSSNSLGP